MWSAFKSPEVPSGGAESSSAPAPAGSTGGGALQIWARQVENARQQTETAVTDLTVRFGDIVQKMDASIASSEREAASHAQAATVDGEQAARQLSQVTAALHEMQRGRDVLTAEIAAIVTYIAELQRMAEDVKLIAFQTNMLSVNAAIQAAHAGEGGRGFAVVAHEVQTLSKASRDTGQKIDQRVGAITATLRKIGEHNKSVSGHDAEAIRTSEESIRVVLERQRERTSQFAANASSSRAEHNAIKNLIEDALVNLQFQDRVSQILAQVVGAMERADSPAFDGAGAPGGEPVADPVATAEVRQQQLIEMASTYTTEEQRRIHAGLEAGAVTPRDVTFF
jgi:methyl-accepting chemotaxis protein